MKAVLMPDGLAEDIEDGKVNPRDDFKVRGLYLATAEYKLCTECLSIGVLSSWFLKMCKIGWRLALQLCLTIAQGR